MKPVILITTVLLLASSPSRADDAFRTAAVTEIRRAAPGINPSGLRLLASPPLLAPLQRVRLAQARYDANLLQWQLQLVCVPSQACLPSLGLINSPDPGLFLRPSSPTTPPLVYPGDRKELVASFGGLRLHKSVVCLQPGRAGDVIRVRERSGRRIYVATVTAEGALTLENRK